MFFMQHVGDFLARMDEGIGINNLPFIQLLPLATMGSQGHHTVLECSLTLTLNHLAEDRDIGTLRNIVLMNETFRNKFNYLPVKHTFQDLIDARIFEGLLHDSALDQLA